MPPAAHRERSNCAAVEQTAGESRKEGNNSRRSGCKRECRIDTAIFVHEEYFDFDAAYASDVAVGIGKSVECTGDFR